MRIIVVLLIFTLSACGGSRAVVPVSSFGDKAKKTSSSATTYKVRKGDTLYSISFRYGLDYKYLAGINNIRSPYQIFVGQKLHLTPTKIANSQTKTVKKAPATSNKTTTKSKTQPKANTTTNISSLANQNLNWRWPTNGKVISTYSISTAGRKGINIAGKSGQDIVAAAAGKVVYSGNGLPRYGNLLIIKHNDVYLSAYAHNKSLLVKEGQYVKSGQKIATLGSSGAQQNQLHFEIRRNGKPIDPLRFLPKR